jgi:hypothetical protein
VVNAVKRTKIVASSPLPAFDAAILDGDGKTTSKQLNTVLATDQHFMCRMPHYKSDYVPGVRLYSESSDKDMTFTKHDWLEIWGGFCSLQKELKLHTTNKMVFLSAGDIQHTKLVKRGWKSTYQVMKEWLELKSTQDAVLSAISKWRPSVGPDRASSWVGQLVILRRHQPDAYGHIRAILDRSPLKLDNAISSVHAASVGAGKRAGENNPKELVLFEALCTKFGLTMPTNTATRTFLTIADLEDKIAEKHPLTMEFRPETLTALAGKNQRAMITLATMLFN